MSWEAATTSDATRRRTDALRLRGRRPVVIAPQTSIQLAAKTSPMNRAPMTLLFPLVGRPGAGQPLASRPDRGRCKSGEILAGKTPRGISDSGLAALNTPHGSSFAAGIRLAASNLRNVKDGRHRDGQLIVTSPFSSRRGSRARCCAYVCHTEPTFRRNVRIAVDQIQIGSARSALLAGVGYAHRMHRGY